MPTSQHSGTKRKASYSTTHKTILFHKELYEYQDGSVFFKVKNEREKNHLIHLINQRWKAIPKSAEEEHAVCFADGFDKEGRIQFLFLCAPGCELDEVPLQKRIDENKKLHEKSVWQRFITPALKRSKDASVTSTPLQAGSIFSTKKQPAVAAPPHNDEYDLGSSKDWEQFIDTLPGSFDSKPEIPKLK